MRLMAYCRQWSTGDTVWWIRMSQLSEPTTTQPHSVKTAVITALSAWRKAGLLRLWSVTTCQASAVVRTNSALRWRHYHLQSLPRPPAGSTTIPFQPLLSLPPPQSTASAPTNAVDQLISISSFLSPRSRSLKTLSLLVSLLLLPALLRCWLYYHGF